MRTYTSFVNISDYSIFVNNSATAHDNSTVIGVREGLSILTKATLVQMQFVIEEEEYYFSLTSCTDSTFDKNNRSLYILIAI